MSTVRQVNCRVPQGSILGPLLFICYINDLPLQCRNSFPSLYADDTAILATGTNTDEVRLKLQNDLDRLYVWFARNKLSVNCQKTVTVLFTSNRSKFKKDLLNLTLAGEQITQASNTKYLGLYVDSHLNFDEHVKKVCCKINVRTKLLWRVCSFITQELTLILYKSLIGPHFDYCSFIVEGASKTNLAKLQVQQNCALRAVKCVSCYYPSEILHAELKIDSIAVMMTKSTCKFAYKCFYDLCTPSLNNMLTLYTNERELRSNEELNAIVTRCHTQWAERNFAFRAVVYWNSLPKVSPSIDSFKIKIKAYDGFVT